MKDIYFESDYCQINEEIEDGKAEKFEYDGEYGNITYNFIKRKINHELNSDIDYYDIVSPYGYGGPVINKSIDYEKLIKEFSNEFSRYCLENNIVSEFVRFHPIIRNYYDFRYIYNIEFSRQTVGTNLKEYENPVEEEFSKSCKKKIRRLIKDGLTYQVTKSPDELSSFLEFYYSTMNRNSADKFYYFNKTYFEKFVEYYKENIIIVEVFYESKVIAMGFYFLFDEYIHIHLSGTLSEYLNKSPAYILRYAITLWGKENGYSLIHHGGGRSSDPEDGLFKFKKQFGKNTSFDFYIGKKILNQEIYNLLVENSNVDKDTNFFPAYRER